MSFAVIIPTFRRPEWVLRCIKAVINQEVRASRVVVAIKQGDEASFAAVQTARELPGGDVVELAIAPASANVVGQQNVALSQTREDFVALTDDDAEPRPDWLAKMRPYFDEPKVVGVGGRDWQPYERWDVANVGRMSWYGRMSGNHHLGIGPPRDVDVLKGVNCCFRGDVLRRIGFDPRMRGRGTVIHWEVSLCLSLRAEGWRIIYDPQVAVDHHVAPRKDGDTNDRGLFDRESYVDIIHNESLATLDALPPWRKWIYRTWRVGIGTIATPGLLQVLRRCIIKRERPKLVWQRFLAAREGMKLALVTLESGADQQSKRVTVQPVSITAVEARQLNHERD